VNKKYELRLYDMPLLSFEYSKNTFGVYNVSHVRLLSDKREIFPLDLETTPDGVNSWLDKRVIPKNRAFVEEILKSLELERDDTKGIIDICKGLSLNDSYWVVSEDFKGKFAEYNLYENHFSEVLGLVAYTGVGAPDPAFSTSPELTTDGMLPKAWRFVDNGGKGIYLYKGGTSGASNAGNEPYSEFYASQIAQKMELNAVFYDLVKWKGILASKCKLFTNIDTSYVPIWKIIGTNDLSKVVNYYEEMGEAFKNSINDMLVFDALIYNCDRHFGNFGLLRDNHTGRIIAPAPIFDNGCSLFHFGSEERLKNVEEYASELRPAYPKLKFETIVESIITPRQVEKLRSMVSFKFERHEMYNLPEWRLEIIEKHLRKRASQLINLPRSREKLPEIIERPSLLERFEDAKREAEAGRKDVSAQGKKDHNID
jgi:hypothetical protein